MDVGAAQVVLVSLRLVRGSSVVMWCDVRVVVRFNSTTKLTEYSGDADPA